MSGTLATEEALANVFHHAYPHDTGEVELSLAADETCLVVEIVDRGIPFDILSLERPDLEAGIEDRKVGGLGVFLIRELMDDVSCRREGNRNVLRLVVSKPDTSKKMKP